MGSVGGTGALTIADGGSVISSNVSIWVSGGITLDAGTLSVSATLNNAGTLNLGNESLAIGGAFIQSSTGSLLMQINSPEDFGSLAANTIILDGALVIDLVSGFTPGLDSSFALFTADNAILGSFTSITSSNPGIQWSFALDGNTSMLTLTAVPEPATYALLIGLAAFLAVIYQRKRANAVGASGVACNSTPTLPRP